MLQHLEAVLRFSKKKNLTGITSIEDGKVLHIEDSLAVLPELAEAPEGRLADLGSGAGYPGIPLALASGRKTILIEANKKKAAFLNDFLVEHGLIAQIIVANQRSEELVGEASQCAAVTVRAVAALPVLLELATPLLVPKGHVIALKGRPDQTEIERGLQAAELLGLSLFSEREYTLSDGKSKRCVLVFEKTGETALSLPRKPGMAEKRPLA